ncbi:MAG: pyruvate kinase [Calditrichaeota bacterium]|nr:MAG: pyruvate kinase [Calditrichota bacterium]
MKKTKIIATYGPAVSSGTKVKQLVDAGVNLFRINCSHGKREDFLKAVKIIRQGTKSARFPVGILFDISGPKLRVDRFDGELPVKSGDRVTLTTDTTDLSQKKIAVNHPAIIASVKKGERLFIDDGNIVFKILKTNKTEIVIKAENNETILPGKGINLPDTKLKIPTITEKDKKDIKTAVDAKADYIALSFVRSGDDIIEAGKLIRKYGGTQWVIAKLEKREAIEDLDTIMLLADGVMVARGDLGVELPFAELPRMQKDIIRLANYHHKPVIIATQMLESMRFSPRATRAEVNDVATAVFDFVDAVMLSAETATGNYPVETVKAMTEVIEATEEVSVKGDTAVDKHLIKSEITQAIAYSVHTAQEDTDVKMIAAYTSSGFTARLISNLFPPQPVIALTSDTKVLAKLCLFRSVYPVKVSQPKTFNAMIKTINGICSKHKLAKQNEMIIIAGGVPFGIRGTTNFMMIHEIT